MDTTDILSLVSLVRQKANMRITTALAQQQVKGLAPSHGDILYALFTSGPLTMAEIATKIHRDKSTVTVLVTKLLQLGYVERRRDGTDGRVYVVSLTARGQALKPVFDAISAELLQTLYQGIRPQDQQTLLSVLLKIEENLS